MIVSSSMSSRLTWMSPAITMPLSSTRSRTSGSWDGDIQVSLLDIELLTIKLRLLVASADKAKEMGIDWWQNDPFLKGGRDGNKLEDRLRQLEQKAGIEQESSDES